MNQTLHLHGALTGNCIRAAIALEEAGIPYDVFHVELAKGEHRKAAHLAINPLGKVPTLIIPNEDETFALSQSNAIMLYAADAGPIRLLPHPDTLARALALERFFYFVTDVIALSHAAWALRPQRLLPAIDTLNERAMSALLAAERYVKKSPFMAGDSFSIADIAAFTIADFMTDAIDWPRHPHFARWFNAISARPAVMRGQTAFRITGA